MMNFAIKNNNIQYRNKAIQDNVWIEEVAKKLWGSTKILSKDTMYEILQLPGFVAELDGAMSGFVLYAIDDAECEIVALYSSVEKQGIGTQLLDLVKNSVREKNVMRVWLQTTNDNTQALRFYQKRGYTIAAVRPNAIEAQRKIKPIPLLGNDGIPIRDEIELEVRF